MTGIMVARRAAGLRWWIGLGGVFLVLMVTAFSSPHRWHFVLKPAPFLCVKDEFRTRCPPLVDGGESLWENPRVATQDWRACAEVIPDDYQRTSPTDRKKASVWGITADQESLKISFTSEVLGSCGIPLETLYPCAAPAGEDGGNGYIGIIAEGGLNQQRISIINAVAVARILNCTLILPVFKQDSIWKDSMQFADVFDVDHFINYLKSDVRIIREPPNWIPHHKVFYSSIGYTIKDIPKYASAEFYIQSVLPRIKEKKLVSLKPFVDRLGYENVALEINKLRCRVNYHALRFLPHLEHMAEVLVARMHNRTGRHHPFLALHLRFEKGMVGLSFCNFAGTRQEKAALYEYRKKEWPRRFKNDTAVMWKQALCKRKQGKCPLEPGEVALMLQGMGYLRDSQIYVASGPMYGGNKRMRPLQQMFPNLVRKEDLATAQELAPFQLHVTSMAVLDFLVCLKSDVYVMTHGGNFAKLVIGSRRYRGHGGKSIKPNKGLMAYALVDPTMRWERFIREVAEMQRGRTGMPEKTFPGYDIWENPLSPCMCPSMFAT